MHFWSENANSVKDYAMLKWSLLFLVLFQNGSTQRPDVSITSVERCGAQTFAILRIVNVSKSDHIFFPLSPMYAQGITVHNVGIEVERSGSWVAIQRGLDLQPAGFRDLGPGEQIIDRVGLPLDQQKVFLKSGRMMRVSVPYKHALSSAYNDVTSPPFKFVSVSAHSSSPPCPAKP
jgi:hypothetical protein